MAGGTLHVNQADVSEDAGTVEQASSGFEPGTIQTGGETTITAYRSLATTFSNSQNVLVSCGQGLATDARNMRSMGAEFAQFDALMGSQNSGN